MAGRPGRKLGHAGNRRAGLLSAARRRKRGRACPWRSRPADTNCNWETRDPGRRRCRWRARLARNEANSFRNYLINFHLRLNLRLQGLKPPFWGGFTAGLKPRPSELTIQKIDSSV